MSTTTDSALTSPAPRAAKSAASALGITSPRGFRAAGVYSGIKADPNKLDVTLIVGETDCSAAGVFTQNRFCAAPVIWSREALRRSAGKARAIVANSGNANAATGSSGRQNAADMASLVDAETGVAAERVLVCSTGPIGVPLPMDKISLGVKAASAALGSGPEHDLAASRGIMTTDAAPKQFGVRGRVAGKMVTVAGIAKGAGMIAPNMATMLAFLTTDAAVAPKVLQALLKSAVADSFNTIRVDGHTSTNDSVLALASGLAGNAEITVAQGPEAAALGKLIARVCLELSLMIVRDGEGAARLCEITVERAKSDAEARAIACALADSPLWKCAMNAGHPNWGRIVCAVGNAVAKAEPEELTVKLGRHVVFAKGKPGKASPAELAAAMQEDPITVRIRLAGGDGRARIRTCDIAHPYITENTGKNT